MPPGLLLDLDAKNTWYTGCNRPKLRRSGLRGGSATYRYRLESRSHETLCKY